MRTHSAHSIRYFAIIFAIFIIGCNGSSSTPTSQITVSLSPGTAQAMDQGQTVAFQASVKNDSSGKGVSWSLSGPGSLSNQTSTSATYKAPSSISSTQSATVTATALADSAATAQVKITANPLPSITVAALPTGTEGTAYSATLTATGGTGAYAWSVTSGALPSWASLNASTGAITGTPNAPGSTNFSVSVKDATGVSSAAEAMSLAVNPPALSVTTKALVPATVGVPYSATLKATGGQLPYSWSVSSGALPAWAALNAATGVISGTPNLSGTANFTVQVTDAENPAATATQALSLTVSGSQILTVVTLSLPNGTVGIPYSATLQASGGKTPYTWSISSGALPAWASLDASTGAITGTPNGTGTANFTVEVADSSNPIATATRALSITANPPAPLTITTATLPDGVVGSAYSALVQATGGIQPYIWSISSGSLPSWATLNPGTGVISGMPNATGLTGFTVEVTDSQSPAATDTQPLSILVTNGGPNSLLAGQYAFVLGGNDGGMAGTFTADGNGNIIAGVEDLEDAANGLSAANVAISSGTYSVASNNRGTLSFTDANHKHFSFSFTLGTIASGVAAKGTMIESDSTGDHFTGDFELQDPSAFSASALSGGYAFGLSGWDAGALPSVVVGSASVASGNVTSGLLDVNDAGTLTSAQAFTGTLTVDATTGRGTITSTVTPANFTFYVVDSTHWLAIAMDSGTGYVAVGEADQQSGGPYSASSLNGTMVLQDQSSNGVPSPHAMVGLFTSPGNGTTSLTADVDDGGTVTSHQTSTPTFAVTNAANGRFTVTPQTGSPLVGYMIAPNKAVFGGTNTRPDFGTFEPQTAGPFNDASLDGSYFFGTLPIVSLPASSVQPIYESGFITFNGTGDFSGTFAYTQGGTLNANDSLLDTYAMGANGRATVATGQLIIYIVSPTKLATLYIGQANFPDPAIQLMER